MKKDLLREKKKAADMNMKNSTTGFRDPFMLMLKRAELFCPSTDL
ncbi:MAG: hypothetical protein WCS93_03260 [Candidatus Delongbacteria bacterium]